MLEPRDLPLLIVFASIVRRGTFTAAAEELGLSKSIVSENLSTLEDRCGVRLLERSTRRLRLTQAGERILEASSGVVAATDTINAVIEEQRDEPVGTLRIATTHDLAARLVAPAAARVLAEHPALRVEVVADDAQHDLIATGFDVGVRLGAPQDSSYGMRKLGTVSEPIVATRLLAEAFAPAMRPKDLHGAPWVRHALVASGESWKFHGPKGEQDELTVSVRGQANTGEGVRALLLGGVGFGALPEHIVQRDLQEGALVRVCPGWTWKRVSLFAVWPSATRVPKRVSRFVTALKEELRRSRLLGEEVG